MMTAIRLTIVCAIFATANASYSATGNEQIFHMVRQDTQTFGAYMKATRSSYQVKVDRTGQTLMHYAAQCQDSIPNIQALLRSRVAPDTADYAGITPFMMAASGYCYTATKELRRAGADLTALDARGWLALHHYAYRDSHKKNFQYVVSDDVDLNTQDKFGRTPLFLAVLTLHVAAVDSLLKAGADVAIADNFGVTAQSLMETPIFKQIATEKRRSRKRFTKVTKLLESFPPVAGEPFRELNYLATDHIEVAYAERRRAADERQVDRPSNASLASRALPCGDTVYENLTEEQGAAISYVIEEENSSSDIKYCIESITADRIVPFRGHQLVEFQMVVMYPNGYKAGCLEKRPSNQDVWNQMEFDTACMPALNGKPIERGGKRTLSGKAEI